MISASYPERLLHTHTGCKSLHLRICKPLFKEKAKEYKKILDLKANDKVRDTFYSEILDIIAAYESGLAGAIKHEYERVEHILSIKETETLFA